MRVDGGERGKKRKREHCVGVWASRYSEMIASSSSSGAFMLRVETCGTDSLVVRSLGWHGS